MDRKAEKRGVSLSELLIASTLAILVIGGILMLVQFVQSNWKTMRAISHVNNQLESAAERIKKDLRMTDAYQLFYYPASAATYSAISFPISSDIDQDGFADINQVTGKISWGYIVVYHTFTNSLGKTELRRTICGYCPSSERQQQIDDVVLYGEPLAATPGYIVIDPGHPDAGGTPFTPELHRAVLAENDNIALEITPSLRKFDGYNATVARSENVTFGSIPLAPGNHYITFSVTGKNPSSSDYRIGIDCFAVTPSGSAREAENTTLRGDGGAAKVNEDMSAYGSWNGNRQLEYQAGGLNDYIGLNFYYDQWIEDNFSVSSPDNAVVEYGSRTGDVTESSGSSEYVARLDGCGDSWAALLQTGASDKSLSNIEIAGADGIIVRNNILSSNIEVIGRAVRVRIDNASSENITIDYAFLMQKQEGPSGVSGSERQITFYDAGGGAAITVPAGSWADSDWIDVNNFDRNSDYLLTLHMPLAAGSHSFSSWTKSDGSEESYIREGAIADAQEANWIDGSYAISDAIFSVESIDSSYLSSGTVTSQIYDSGMEDPSYSALSWNIAKNNYGSYEAGGQGANLIIKVRSDDDETALKAATDWSGALTINTRSALSGSSSISSIGSGRYVQFRCEFYSQPTFGKNDYLKACVLRNLAISWPGQERVVDISGYFTKRPDYGIFSVDIDGHSLTKGLEVNLAISENLFGGRVITKYLTTEEQPRNTGK